MVDRAQVNAIIATAINEFSKAHPEQEIGSEEAKQMAKCIIEALSDAGSGFVYAKNCRISEAVKQSLLGTLEACSVLEPAFFQ